jgi:hypothetical protein
MASRQQRAGNLIFKERLSDYVAGGSHEKV